MRLILKTKRGNIYRLTDPEARVNPDEWTRVCNIIEDLINIAIEEGINISELLMCMNEQI